MDPSWRTAVTATAHCLTGCAAGEVLGMVLTTWWGWGNAANVVVSVVLAFLLGYLLTFTGVRRAGADTRTAVRLALASDTVSILTMEAVDNLGLFAWPGAMDAGLGDGLFWVALAVALAIAFVVAIPVNHWMIGRGRGHAVVHQVVHRSHGSQHTSHGAQHTSHGHH